MKLTFSFRCSHCGDGKISVPDETDDSDFVTCPACRRTLCTIAELNAKFATASAEFVAQDFKNGLADKAGAPPFVELHL
jgi:hypothetical protein